MTPEAWRIQAVEISDGIVLWELLSSIAPMVTATADDYLLVAASDRSSHSRQIVLAALDSRTGVEQWRVSIEASPVGVEVAANRVFVHGQDDVHEVFDLNTQRS